MTTWAPLPTRFTTAVRMPCRRCGQPHALGVRALGVLDHRGACGLPVGAAAATGRGERDRENCEECEPAYGHLSVAPVAAAPCANPSRTAVSSSSAGAVTVPAAKR